MVVSGYDRAGYAITNPNGEQYAFQIIASGSPPVIGVASPTDLSYTCENSVPWTGTVETDGGLSVFEGVVKPYNNSDNNALPTRTVSP